MSARRRRLLVSVTLLANTALCHVAASQIQDQTGNPCDLQEVTYSKLINGPVQQIERLIGRTTVLIIFPFCDRPSDQDVARINELSAEYEDHGITIIAATVLRPPKSYKKMQSLMGGWVHVNFEDVRALWLTVGPTCWVLEDGERVIDSIRFQKLTAEFLNRYRSEASLRPLSEWPSRLSSIKGAVERLELGKAVELIGELTNDEEAERIVRALHEAERHLDDALASSLVAGDYLNVRRLAQRAKERFEGRPISERAAGVLARLQKDREAQSIIRAQEALRRVLRSSSDSDARRRAFLGEVDRLEAQYGGTIVSKEIQQSELIRWVRSETK